MTGQEALNIICGSSSMVGLADKSISDTQYRASALQWLNLILKDISNRQQGFHWRFLEYSTTFATVASQFSYAFTGIGGIATDIDTTKIVSIYDKTNDIAYSYKDYSLFRRKVADETIDVGDPFIFSIFAQALKLWPVPAAIVTTYLDYVRLITAATDAATALDVPAKYDPVVIDGLLTYVYKFDPQLGDTGKQQILYEAGVKRMTQDNDMVISELPKTESHRTRRNMMDDDKRGIFPVDVA